MNNVSVNHVSFVDRVLLCTWREEIPAIALFGLNYATGMNSEIGLNRLWFGDPTRIGAPKGNPGSCRSRGFGKPKKREAD